MSEQGASAHRVVITYGTFDLFHEGHRRLLERARELGTHLIVAVTSPTYDQSRGKLNVQQSLVERVANVQASGLADEVIVEEYEGQKIHDIQQHGVDVFAIGSDWIDKFDYLRDYCEVVYLERTRGVSSTRLRNEQAGILKFGVIGAGRIAHRFVDEARYVSGVDVHGVWSRTRASAAEFARTHELKLTAVDVDELLEQVDAVYIASPHPSHFEHAMRAIDAGRHVLVEKPITLTKAEAEVLYQAAEAKGVVLLEAIKTAFSPGFLRLVSMVRSGSIGDIRSVDATFTKLVSEGRELDPDQAGGSISELASYPLVAIAKLLGTAHVDQRTVSFKPEDSGVETFSRIDLRFPGAVASARTGLGVKAEGELIVAGSRGYAYVPAPWWKTSYFELRFENPGENRRFHFPFEGEGLRYEIAAFYELIRRDRRETYVLRASESVWMAGVIEEARARADLFG